MMDNTHNRSGAPASSHNVFLRRVKDAIRELLPDAEVILYGSRARGEARADSDWDLLVLTDQPVTTQVEEALWDRLFPIEVETTEVISAFVKNRRDWSTALAKASPYHRNIERDGVAV
ncbi:MAG: nucleotidyltransferase domain-containing protein [Armatimonadota bacterium]